MNVWLVTVGEPLPIDGDGGDRLHRAGTLATMLAQQGHKVVWWTSTFDHVRKRQRFARDTTLSLENGLALKLLHGCGYARNVSIRRIMDHAILGRKFAQQAEEVSRPDIILCSLPPLDLPVAATQYGKAHRVPVIVDVRDLWPDIFLELVPGWSRPLFKLGLGWMWRQARNGCRDAFAITGNSPDFVNWGLEHAGRAASFLDCHFPFGYTALAPTQREREQSNSFWGGHGIREESAEFTVCFFGAFGKQFDFETVIDAALMLESDGVRVRFVLCGTGERLDAVKARAGNSKAVIFPGWVGQIEIWTLMALSDVGIAPYKGHSGFIGNLPNKPIEYMAGSLPVVSGLDGYLGDFLRANECGLVYQQGDARALADAIVRLIENPDLVQKMSANAYRTYAEQFEANTVYGRMISHLNTVISAYPARGASAPLAN